MGAGELICVRGQNGRVRRECGRGAHFARPDRRLGRETRMSPPQGCYAGIERNHEQQALTRALRTFACEVGAQVIAEGIEEPAELPTLQDLGVPWGQGYLISRPAPRQPVRA